MIRVLSVVSVVIFPCLTVNPSGNAKTGNDGLKLATIAAAAAGTDAENFGFFAYNFFQLEIKLYLSPSLGMELKFDLFLISRLRIGYREGRKRSLSMQF